MRIRVRLPVVELCGSGKLHRQGVYLGVVRNILGWKWSLQQISATRKRFFFHQCNGGRVRFSVCQIGVSYRTIFIAVYDKHCLRGVLQSDVVVMR